MAKNIKDLLVDATKYPAAIEAKLPAGAPKLSTMLLDTAGMIPVVPDFPMELPALPAPPELPAMPESPGGELGKPRFVEKVEITPVRAASPKREVVPLPRKTVTPLAQAYTQPIEGVLGQVTTRRGM